MRDANDTGHVGLTRAAVVLILFYMTVETIGDAYSLARRVIARCSRGKEDHRTHTRECSHRREVDIETLVWTRGRDFPLSRLESRLRCPRCGSRSIVVMFQPPTNTAVNKA
jgi:DNA-directed RNA polymerase subunit RPC12/RpoP